MPLMGGGTPLPLATEGKGVKNASPTEDNAWHTIATKDITVSRASSALCVLGGSAHGGAIGPVYLRVTIAGVERISKTVGAGVQTFVEESAVFNVAIGVVTLNIDYKGANGKGGQVYGTASFLQWYE